MISRRTCLVCWAAFRLDAAGDVRQEVLVAADAVDIEHAALLGKLAGYTVVLDWIVSLAHEYSTRIRTAQLGRLI